MMTWSIHNKKGHDVNSDTTTFCVFIVFTTMSFHRNYIFGQGPSGVVPGSTLRELGEVFCVGIGGQIVELVRGV